MGFALVSGSLPHRCPSPFIKPQNGAGRGYDLWGACFHNVEDEWNLGPKLKQVKQWNLRSFFYCSNTATQANQANLTKTLQNHDRAFQDFLPPPLQFHKWFLYKRNFSIKWFSLQILSSAYILYRMVWPGLFYRMPTNIDALYKMLVRRSKKVKW